MKIRLDAGRFDEAAKCIGLLNEFVDRAWSEHIYSREKVAGVLEIAHRVVVANLNLFDYFRRCGLA